MKYCNAWAELVIQKVNCAAPVWFCNLFLFFVVAHLNVQRDLGGGRWRQSASESLKSSHMQIESKGARRGWGMRLTRLHTRTMQERHLPSTTRSLLPVGVRVSDRSNSESDELKPQLLLMGIDSTLHANSQQWISV